MNSKVTKNLVKASSAVALASALIAAGEISGVLETSTVHAAHIGALEEDNKFLVNGLPEYAFLKADGQIVFCIEPRAWLDSDKDFPSLKPSDTRLDRKTLKDIEEIAYFAYYSQSQSKTDYIVAQAMIWDRVVGGTYDIPSVPDIESRKAEVKSRINAYKKGFSEDKKTFTVTLGDTLTVTDSNGWLSTVGAKSSQLQGWNVAINGNSMTISPTGEAQDGKIKIEPAALKPYEGTSIVYATTEKTATPHGPLDIQDVAMLKMKDLDPAVLNLKAIKYMSVHTEKSISSINRLMTDAEAKAAGVDLTQTVFALYKDGKPVKWTDTEHVRPETTVTKGTRVDGDEVKVKADASGEVQIDKLIRKGTYELREVVAPEETTMDSTPSVTFSAIEATNIGGENPVVSKVNDEENKSTTNANGVVNALIPRMSIATEKSISSYGRMITDEVAKQNGADVSQTVFELYKGGQPVQWSDSASVDAKTKVTIGTKVEGSATVKIKADADGKVGIEKIKEGDYELREVTAPDETRMDLTPSVNFTAAEARKKAIETDTVQNVLIEKFNDEDRADSTASSKGVVNTLIQRATIKTEKSIKANGRLLTDEEAKQVGTDVSQTVFELLKNGKPIEWSDNNSVDSKTSVATGTKVEGSTTVKIKADVKGEVEIKGLILSADDSDVFTWKEVVDPEDTYRDSTPTVDITAAEVKEAALAKNTIQNARVEKLNDEENKSLQNSQGIINTLHEFELEVQKTFTMTGTTREGMTSKVGTDEKFSSAAYSELLRLNKFNYSDVRVQLQYEDGTPVKWSDEGMFFYRTKEISAPTKGTFASTEGAVVLTPDNSGKIALDHLVTNGKKYRLAEIATSSRTSRDDSTHAVDGDESNDNTTATKVEFFNNVDYTGIKLVKELDYLKTADKDTRANATVEGAEYTLYYGDGEKKDQPVKVGDAVLEKIKMSSDTNMSKSGNVVFKTGSKGLVANIDNIVYGSYYLLETKAAQGTHLDTKRHYFGDKVEMPEGSLYYKPTEHWKDDTQKSTSLESEGTVQDPVKLISTELEKRIKHIGADSPFQTSVRTAWGQTGSPITYQFGDTSVDYYSKQFGKSKAEGNEYTLYYRTNTLDGKGVQDKPVKWTDEAVQHMKVTKGIKVSGDNVTLSTDKDGKIAAENIAYGSYYWKETKTSDGLAKDLKEYIFGFQSVQDPTYSQDDKLKSKLNENETQTNEKLSETDATKNYHFDNTFAKGKYGSTDTILTFGFSGNKIADYLDNKVQTDGENGVKLTLTPINGTVGEPISTTTARTYFTDNSGRVKSQDGYFEFRTIPFGQYIMTSDGSNADTKDNTLAKLLDMHPIIVTMTRESDGQNYKLTMHLDDNKDGKLDENDRLLNTWTSKNGDLPTQAQLDAVLHGTDLIYSAYGAGKNGADVNEGDDYVWTRANNKDVNSEGSSNKNFISGEIFVGNSGFEIVDKPENPPIEPKVEIGTTATDAVDGDKVIESNNETAEISDKVAFVVQGNGLEKGKTYTLRAQAVDTKSGQKVGEPVYHTFVYNGQDSETVKVSVDTTDLNDHSFTMFEALYEGEVNKESEPSKTPKALHEDVNSKEQTVKTDTSSVEIGTTATDKSDNDKIVQANSKESIVDKISLKVQGRGLIEGKKYTAEAQLMKKSDQSQIGETVYYTFEYKKGMESVDVEIPVDTAALHNQDVVVFETLYKGEVTKDTEENKRKKITEHKDINDEGQTVKVVHNGEIKTKATDGVDGDKTISASKGTSIVDEIDLKKANLNVGEKYPVNAVPTIPFTDDMKEKFKDKEPVKFEDLKADQISEPTLVLDQNGQKAVALPFKSVKVLDEKGQPTSSNEFQYTEGMKSVKVLIEGVDTSEFAPNKKVVMFERIASDTITPLVHADINDEDQTVKTEAKMHTTLFAIGGDESNPLTNKNFNAGAYTVAYDEVTIYGTDPNRKANVTATLMTPTEDKELDKKDGKEDGMTPYLDASGKVVTKTVQITPTKGNVKFKVWLEFESNNKDQKIVAYETATWEGEEKPFTSHEDPKSKEQTIESIKLEITTKAHDKDNDQVLERSKNALAYDDTEASNLIAGQRYIVKASLMKIVGNGQPQEIFSTSTEFVAESDKWNHKFETEVDTSEDTEDVRYVWYEWLYDGVIETDADKEDQLADHADPSNKSQTLKVEPKSETPRKKFAETGEIAMTWISALGALIFGSMFGYEFFKRRRNNKDEA